ncbi:MAG TPA: hypothetical protein ENN97_08690 [Phycisphaerales bacterium]|nr:hypothetical protein [Phycisphaerales bacterium]
MGNRPPFFNTLFRSSRAAVAGMMALTLLGIGLMFLQLSYPELKSVHEARVVVTAENMVRRGDWVAPVFNDEIRLEKPPLPYWVVAATRTIAGSMEEPVFRLPSAVMGAAGVLLAALCARLMFGRNAALLAGVFTALMLMYVIEARLAEVDIYLTFCVTVCLFLMCHICFGTHRRDWVWLLLGAAVAAGGLAKGPVIFIFAVPLILLGCLLYPDRRPKAIWFVGCLGVFAILSAIWPLLVIQRVGWDTVRDVWFSDIMRNVAEYTRQRRPWHFYLTRYLMVAFPWSVLAGAAALLPFWKEVKANRTLWRKTLFLVLSMATVILAFSLVRKKKIDYLVPLAPIIGILIAAAWDIIRDNMARRTPAARANRILLSAQAILFIAMGAVALVYSFFDPLNRTALMILAGIGLCLGGAAGVYFINKNMPTAALMGQGAGFLLFGYLLFGLFVPQENVRISPARFCSAAREVIDDAPVVYFKGRDDTLVYHLDRTIQRVGSTTELRTFLDQHPDAFVLVRHRFLDEAQSVAEHIVFHHPRMRDLELPLPEFPFGNEDDEAHEEEVLGDTGYYYNIYILKAGRWDAPPRIFDTYEVEAPSWLTAEFLWVGFGLIAQTMFFMRFLVQWIASEKAKQSVVPVLFWWLSLSGGLMLLTYAIYRRDPVFIFGQSTGVFIYLRNLWLIYGYKEPTAGAVREKSDVLEESVAFQNHGASD